LDEEKYQKIKLAAESAQEPVTGWIRRAVYGMLRKWEVPEPKSKKVYGKCSVCGKKHDKSEHGL